MDTSNLDDLSTPTPMGPSPKISLNRLIIVLEPECALSDASALATLVGGIVVAKDPSLSIYEIDLPGNTDRGILDAAIAYINGGVPTNCASWADYAEVADKAQACYSPTTNFEASLGTTNNCTYTDIDFYTALHLFKKYETRIRNFRSKGANKPVTVMIVDTGLEVSTHRFDTLWATNPLGVPKIRWIDKSYLLSATPKSDIDTVYGGHGTMAASIIAADNSPAKKSPAGLALAFLGRDISIIVATSTDQSIWQDLTMMRLWSRFADVVNIEDVVYAHDNYNLVSRAKLVTEFRDILENTPNTLFVAPAPNYGIPVYDSKNATDPRFVTLYAGVLKPNGDQYANLVGVTGTSYCNQHQFRSIPNSSGTWFYKAPLDPAVVAPSEVVPVVKKNGARDYASGNSFAVPIVSSLAAIIRWLRPEKTAAEIKGNLFEYGNKRGPTDAAGNYYPPVNFAQQIIRQLIALAQDAGFINEITPFVARMLGPSTPDPIGTVMTQVCGEKFEFVQHANIPESPPPGDPPPIFYDDRQRNYTALVDPFIDISSNGTSTTWFIKVTSAAGDYDIEIGCPGCGFQLNTWYLISQSSNASLRFRRKIGLPTSYPIWSADESAFSTGGIKFTQCQITQNSWWESNLREPPQQQGTFLYFKGSSPWYAIVKGVIENLITEVTYIKDDQPGTTPKIDPAARVEKKEFTLKASIDCELDPVLCHDLNEMCYGGSFNFPTDYPLP